MPPGPQVPVRISRETIRRGEVEKVLSLLEGFIPEKLETFRNRVVFHVGGYGGEERELYEIGEVRDFFDKLFEVCPGLFHWLEASDQGILFLALMVCAPVQGEGEVRISGEDMQVFLADGLRSLCRFSEENGIDPEPSVSALSGFIRKKISQ